MAYTRALVALAVAACETAAPAGRTTTPARPTPEADRVPFGPDERVAELAVLRDALRDDYAHLETKHAQWGVDLDALFAHYGPQLHDADTWGKYEAVMAAFVAELHDGHVQWRRKRGASETKRRIARIGVDAKFVGEQLIVSEVWPGSGAERAGLKRGDRIIALDGDSIEQRMGALAELRSSSRTDASRYDYAQEWAVSRIPADAPPKERRVTRERPDGSYETLAVIPETKPPAGRTKPPAIELQWRGNAALLVVHNLKGHVKDTTKLATDAAAQIFARSHGLVIDLRDNEGGYEDAALAIAGMFATKPVVGGTTRVRLSAAARSQHKVWQDMPEDPAKPGWSTVVPIQATGTATRPYAAPIAVVIDAGCRSSCESLALLLRALGARLVGERTGGAGGAPISITLPSSKATVGIPARASFDPTGVSIEGVGVGPDDAVLPTRDDLAAGKDPALDRALAFVCPQGAC